MNWTAFHKFKRRMNTSWYEGLLLSIGYEGAEYIKYMAQYQNVLRRCWRDKA